MFNIIQRGVLKKHLRNKLADLPTDSEAHRAVAAILWRPVKLARLNDSVDDLAIEVMAPEDVVRLQAVSESADGQLIGGPILDSLLKFLNDHWADILAIILKLIGS